MAILLGSTAHAAELIMFRRAGCPYCLAWDRDVGAIYAKTEIGRKIQIQQIELGNARLKISLKSPVIYTPTFVLVEHDREIGRIEGYPGESFFWGLLQGLVQRLHSQPLNGLPTAEPATTQYSQ